MIVCLFGQVQVKWDIQIFTILDILCLNEGNLKRVNRCALKFYTLKIESVSYMRVRSKSSSVVTCVSY